MAGAVGTALRSRLPFALLVIAAILPVSARAMDYGTNGPSAKKADLEPVFKVMKARGLTQFRIGVNLTKDTERVEAPMLKRAIALSKIYGITLHPLIGFAFAWGDRTNGSIRRVMSAALYDKDADGTSLVRSYDARTRSNRCGWGTGRDLPRAEHEQQTICRPGRYGRGV